jgi:hypothetical protein
MTPAFDVRSNETVLRQTFLKLMEEGQPDSKARMADLIVDRSPEPFQAWAREQLLALVGRLWPKPVSESKALQQSLQQFLPGFEPSVPKSEQLNLSRRLPLKDGATKPLGKMIVTEIHEAIRLIRHDARKKPEPTVDWLQDLANNMSPYSERYYNPVEPVTVQKYAEFKRDGVPVPVVRSREQHSADIKAKWAKMTPKQRADVARKREAVKRKKKGDDDD